MLFKETIPQDIEQLTRWIRHDPYHKDHVDPIWWLTGQGLLSYKLEDRSGVTMYVRVEGDKNLLRLHTQFAPEEEVSKIRVIRSLLWALPIMKTVAKEHNLTGFVFQSVSPSLINFMISKFGFAPIGNDDYSVLFEETV